MTDRDCGSLPLDVVPHVLAFAVARCADIAALAATSRAYRDSLALAPLLVELADLRLTPEDGLTHAYCAQFNDPETEVVSDAFVSIHHNDNKKHRTEIYREALYSLVDKSYATTPRKKR